MSVLTLQYRPVRFADVVGQGHIKPILRAFVRSQNPPPALIFGGTRGTGKTTDARILAAALNCPEAQDLKGDACGVCPSCLSVQKANCPSVLEIDAASNTGIDDIRSIKELCMYATDGLWRVVLLDEAHSLSKQAFNALLKILEEPPPQTVFVLLTTEVDKILETVRSRSMYFEFRRMTVDDIVGRLKHIAQAESFDVSPDLFAEIAQRVQGGMRDAVMLLDQCSRVGVSTVEGFRDLFGIQNVAVPLFEAALAGDHAAGSKVVEDYFYRVGDAAGMVNDLVALVRDLLILKSGGGLNTDEATAAIRQSLSGKVDVRQLVSVIRVLWDLKTRTRAVDNDQRAAMEMALVLIAEALNPTSATRSTAAPMQKPAGDAKLSLAELRALA